MAKKSKAVHAKTKSKKTMWQKTVHFLWEEDSILSWVVNIILMFLIIKFILYPVIGFSLGTTHPVVAVVSGSMEHRGVKFDAWYDSQKSLYANYNISKEQFKTFGMVNGFNKGDIIILTGYRGKDPKVGEILVFWSGRTDPIIHRVVETYEINGVTYAHTKGDNNLGSLPEELQISPDKEVGRAVFRIPYLGWVKIWFTDGVNWVLHRT